MEPPQPPPADDRGPTFDEASTKGSLAVASPCFTFPRSLRGERNPRLDPRASHPAVTRDARRAGDKLSSNSLRSHHDTVAPFHVIHSQRATSCRERNVLPSAAIALPGCRYGRDTIGQPRATVAGE